ncbi:MAG: hypothetical protein J6M06_00955 [Synergistaceae bacterium]|nr:hypothetical protein [Synergistaceae bacterium]
MLIVTFEVDADYFPQGVKERIGMMLEQFGGRVKCVDVKQKGAVQQTFDSWQEKRT